MKTNILFISFLFCCFCSNAQELTQQDLESFYKVLVIQTDKAIDAKKYDYATVYENSYRFVRQLPLNDSIDNSSPDRYFSLLQLNKDNSEVFPGFVIQLDKEPKEERGYFVHSMPLEGDQFAGLVEVSTPGTATVADFESFLTDMIEKDYYMLSEDYKALMEIQKKLKMVGTKFSPKVVQPVSGNRVKLVDPVKVNPRLKAVPVTKEFKTIQK